LTNLNCGWLSSCRKNPSRDLRRHDGHAAGQMVAQVIIERANALCFGVHVESPFCLDLTCRRSRPRSLIEVDAWSRHRQRRPSVPIKRGKAMAGNRTGLCGGPLLRGLLRLQVVQIIGGALRMGGGAEDRPLVVLQHRDPRLDVGGVILADFRRDVEIGA
jgi:hypothetical protein